MRAARLFWIVCSVFFLVVGLTAMTHAQTNQGTDFWLAETTNSLAGSAHFAIAIANPSGSTANITIEHFGSANLLDTVPSGGLKTYTFPRLGVCSVGGVNQGKNMVYHVTSDVDVVVYIFNPIENVFTNDASLILPVDALGKLHRVGSYVNPNGNTRGSFLGVVAAQDGTNIQVFDRSGTLMNNVTINKGEYFQRVNGSCGGSNDAVSTDVTGWRVDTSVPAAVFSGSNCTSLGNGTGACDHIEEQIIPEEALANTYVASPTLSRPVGCNPTIPGSCTQDVFRYVATEANTTVSTSPNVGGGLLANPGDFVETTTATPHIVTADKPIYGYQYLISQTSGSPQAGTGDPAMLAMPPVDQFQFSYIFLTPGTYAYDFINVVSPVGTAITFDGNPLTSTCTPIGTIGGVTYCFIVKQVADGVHTISGDKKFGLVVSGFDSFASYAYLGGVGLQPINAGCDTGGPYQVQSCNVPAAIQLNGTPSCSDGSTPTVVWSSNSGVTFDNPASEDPTATVPGFGTFNITMTVQCAGAAQPVQCSSTIQVDEKTEGCNQPPDAICQPVTVNTDPGVCTTASASVNNGSNDPDQGDSITLVQAPAGPYGLGTTTVTLTATDTHNASDSCMATATVVDAEKPSITCPAPQTLECVGGGASATVNATASDNCSVSSVGCSPGSGTFPLGTTQSTCTATDGSGNSSQCTTTVTVKDTQAPSITCPAPATVHTSSQAGVCLASLAVAATATDACNGTIGANCSPSSLSLSAPGSASSSCSASDTSGNSSSCNTSLTLVDDTAPTVACPAPVTAECTGGGGATVTTSATATDNCAGSLPATGPGTVFYALGTTSISYSASDPSGNNNSCSSSVKVVDTTPPNISCPAPIVAECTGSGAATVTPGAATASDICGAVTVAGPGAGSYPLGTTTVNYTATDGVGLQNSCQAAIQVVDTTKPVVSCVESVNPSGKNVPKASNTNQDGFYRVGAGDSCTLPVIKIGSFTLANGETIKITQTPGKSGVTYVNTMGPEQIRHFQVGPGDAVITATDGSGNSSSVTCLVPPPPK